MLKIWGRLSSINVKKVVWTAQELGLPFERIEAGGKFGVVDTPAYRAMNPNGVVPVLQDGDYTLHESNVIVRYLCARHAPGRLYPDALGERFHAESWMDWQQTQLNPASRPGFIQLVRTTPADRQPEVLKASNEKVEALMALLDAHLARQAHMNGADFSMADIPIACEVHRWFGLPQTRQPRPHIERWYQGLRARPASAGVLDQALA